MESKKWLLSATAMVLISLVSGSASAQNFGDWEPPTNVGSPVSTTSLDGCPSVSKDGLSLYFASNRAGGYGGNDIYVAQREHAEDDWGVPVNLGPVINTTSDEICPSLTVDGHHLYFVSNRPGCGGQDLYTSRRQDKHEQNWESPINLGCQVNSAQNDFSPSLFEDDAGILNLYFSSNRPDGVGGVDIYVSTLQSDETFSNATNVTDLNTTSDDQRPNVRQRDGLEILFDSNRPGSLGFDLWTSGRETTSSSWSPPVNLEIVNSPSTEGRPSLSWDGTTLYFHSNRTGTTGGLDIYVSRRMRNAKLPE